MAAARMATASHALSLRLLSGASDGPHAEQSGSNSFLAGASSSCIRGLALQNLMLVGPCHRDNDTSIGSLTPVGCKEYWVSRTECVNRVCKSTGLPSSLTTFLICFQAALESSAVTLWVRADRPLTVLLSLGALSESTWSACHLKTDFFLTPSCPGMYLGCVAGNCALRTCQEVLHMLWPCFQIGNMIKSSTPGSAVTAWLGNRCLGVTPKFSAELGFPTQLNLKIWKPKLASWRL